MISSTIESTNATGNHYVRPDSLPSYREIKKEISCVIMLDYIELPTRITNLFSQRIHHGLCNKRRAHHRASLQDNPSNPHRRTSHIGSQWLINLQKTKNIGLVRKYLKDQFFTTGTRNPIPEQNRLTIAVLRDTSITAIDLRISRRLRSGTKWKKLGFRS